MFKNPVAINSEQHSRLRFTPADNFSYARGLNHTPVMAFELEKIAEYYPVVFETSTGLPMAVLGLLKGSNAFLDNDDKWCAPAIPALFSCYPFGLYHGKNDQYVMIMDQSADTLGNKKGKLLYNKQGDGFRMSPLLKDIKARLQAIEKQRLVTNRAFATVAEKGVLAKHQADFTLGDTEHKLRGFSIVDWDKVKQLDSVTLEQWKQNGILALLEAQTASLKNFKVVQKLQQLHLPA